MINKRSYIKWTFTCLIAVAVIVWILVQPVPVNWIVKNLRFLRLVDDYARVEPVMSRWSHSTPSIEDAISFQDSIAQKPFAYLSEFGLKSFLELYSPAIIESRVERVKTVLLSPCSIKMKKRALVDPLQVRDFMRTTLNPALTSNCPALYVCTFGDTKESAMQAAEASQRQLSLLRNKGIIGPSQGVCSFLCSEEQQKVRLSEINHTLNAFKWLTNFKQAVIKEELDIELFRLFMNKMNKMRDGKAKPLSISLQLNNLHHNGLKSIERYFFFRSKKGYVCVQRVLTPENISQNSVRNIIVNSLKNSYIDAAVVSPKLLEIKYHSLLHYLIIAIIIIWCLGIVGALLVVSIRRSIARVILGNAADSYVLYFDIQSDYKNFFASFGIKKCTAFIDIEKIISNNNNKNLAVKLTEKRVHRTLRGKQFRRTDILTVKSLDKNTNEKIFYLKRASGQYSKLLKNEYKVYQKMKEAGIPTAELISYGEILRDGLKTTFLCTSNLDGYISLDEWQIQLANDNSDYSTQQRKTKFLSEMAKIISSSHNAHIYKFGWAVKHILLKELPSGTIKIKLIDVKRAALPSLTNYLIPFRNTRQKINDLTAVNTQLYLGLFTFRDRVSAFKKYSRNIFPIKKQNKIIGEIIRASIETGYFQFKIRKNKIFVNPELSAQTAKLQNLAFDDIMKLKGVDLITRKKVRTVVTLKKDDHIWYLKRHFKTFAKDSLLEFLRYRKPMSNARLEWQAIQILTAIGIPNVPAIAMGEDFKNKIFEKSSFIITDELKNGRSLEQILNEGISLSVNNIIRLTERVGKLARKLHNSGLTHRDFYLGHIYVVGDLSKEYKLHLLDLQRVKPGAKIYNRWSVKDLSALLFSSNAIKCISSTDKMRFLFTYLNIKTLDRKSKYFIYKLLAKNDKIAKHTVKLLKKRRKSGELPPVKIS
ncbi:MAG: hypothetical protein DRI44_04240 [Chlamydiae bacterium]|nr:MAG: hypothetical protein DRI44_04240 [Chlamydiota bacterium]